MAYSLTAGSSHYFSLGGLTLGYPLTLAAFVRRGGRGATDMPYVAVSDGSLKCEIGINTTGTGLAYARTDNGTSQSEASVGTLSTTNYVMLVGIFQNSASRTCWNGSGTATDTTSITGSFGSPVTLEIGRDPLNTSRFGTFAVADVAIYNNGISAMYRSYWEANYSYLYGTQFLVSLLGHWMMKHGLSSIVGGKTLTPNNSPVLNADQPVFYPRTHRFVA